MDSPTIRAKVEEKLRHYCSYRSNVRRLAYALDAHSVSLYPGPYQERPEGGPTNIETKLAREAAGGPFEPHSVLLINRAAVQLVGSPATIFEVGCGTGMFASLVAGRHPTAQVTASELDEKTLAWARANRPAPNLMYRRLTLEECATDQFDLVVALEVVEHIFDYAGFLAGCSRVAPRAIISTPNKARDPFSSVANTPAYGEHVREWTAGEFFWVLRCFYDNVGLYTLPRFAAQIRRFVRDPSFVPTVSRCDEREREGALIAVCAAPRRR